MSLYEVLFIQTRFTEIIHSYKIPISGCTCHNLISLIIITVKRRHVCEHGDDVLYHISY